MDLADLYRKSESLRVAEDCVREFGLDDRAWILELIPKNSVGAEVGVFTGMFSEKILTIVQPKQLFLVDWWEAQGEYFSDWGKYTDFGRLKTADAKDAVRFRVERYGNPDDVQIVECESINWLQSQCDASLDWVYLDTDHRYAQTFAELQAVVAKLKPGGIIVGDDWYSDYGHIHAGVMLAVNDFIRASDFDILVAGRANQFMIMKRDSSKIKIK